ncbi:MAG: hypothetical protein M0C28_39130 [Candidatus Moduliflexus flocculans]|nr:hypothetical protein [Candidatus Moduliflexus flocculans]
MARRESAALVLGSLGRIAGASPIRPDGGFQLHAGGSGLHGTLVSKADARPRLRDARDVSCGRPTGRRLRSTASGPSFLRDCRSTISSSGRRSPSCGRASCPGPWPADSFPTTTPSWPTCGFARR